jgi:triacylglycerol lipase
VLSSLSPPRRRLVLSLLAALAVLATGLAVLLAARAPAAREGPPDVRVPPDEPGPVLLVPGYGGSRRALEVLGDRLRAEGRQVSVLTSPATAPATCGKPLPCSTRGVLLPVHVAGTVGQRQASSASPSALGLWAHDGLPVRWCHRCAPRACRASSCRADATTPVVRVDGP